MGEQKGGISTDKARQIMALQKQIRALAAERDALQERVRELEEAWKQGVLQREIHLLPETEAAVHIAELQDRLDTVNHALRLEQSAVQRRDRRIAELERENEALRDRKHELEIFVKTRLWIEDAARKENP